MNLLELVKEKVLQNDRVGKIEVNTDDIRIWHEFWSSDELDKLLDKVKNKQPLTDIEMRVCAGAYLGMYLGMSGSGIANMYEYTFNAMINVKESESL